MEKNTQEKESKIFDELFANDLIKRISIAITIILLLKVSAGYQFLRPLQSFFLIPETGFLMVSVG